MERRSGTKYFNRFIIYEMESRAFTARPFSQPQQHIFIRLPRRRKQFLPAKNPLIYENFIYQNKKAREKANLRHQTEKLSASNVNKPRKPSPCLLVLFIVSILRNYFVINSECSDGSGARLGRIRNSLISFMSHAPARSKRASEARFIRTLEYVTAWVEEGKNR
jgi:hypothetical protein